MNEPHPAPPPTAPAEDEVELTMTGDDPAAAAAATTPEVDATPYDWLDKLGEGAMGSVFMIRDRLLRRRAALKEIRPEMAQHQQALCRFLSEAQITAQLDHPNIVPIYAIERRPDGTVAYSMKLVRGRELRVILDEVRVLHTEHKPIPPAHTLEARLDVFLKLCDAVGFAHSKGVIHRDLKPANVMIGAFGELYLMDWGIARRIGARDAALDAPVELSGLDGQATTPELTMVGQAIGTPRYMSPEQAVGRNSELDGRSDEYSLGIILFEMVSLRRAVPGRTMVETITNVMNAQKEPLVHIDEKVKIPREIRSIVDKATQREPANRYPTVADMAEDVRRYLRGEAVKAAPDSAAQATLRWLKRHLPLAVSCVLVVLLAFAAVTIYSLVARQQAIAKARVREQQLSRFQTRVAHQSHRIDSWLVRYEERARALAAAAAELIDHGAPVEGVVYDHVDYRELKAVPPDLADSPAIYGKKVSVTCPVFKPSPGVTREQVEPLARKLWPLARRMRQTFIDSRTNNEPVGDEAAVAELLRVKGVPLRSTYIGLAEGMMFTFPGKAYADSYEPRERPWYVDGQKNPRVGWGSPHFDAHTTQLTLTCTSPLFDGTGTWRGVVGLDVTFDYLIRELLSLPGLEGFVEGILFNGDGKVVVRTSDLGKQSSTAAKFEPREFEDPRIAAAVQSGQSGWREVEVDGKGVLYAHFRLESLGWSFVVKADLAQVLAAGPETP